MSEVRNVKNTINNKKMLKSAHATAILEKVFILVRFFIYWVYLFLRKLRTDHSCNYEICNDKVPAGFNAVRIKHSLVL